MTTITLDLPDALVRRAGLAAQAVHRPLEEVLASMLEGALPALDEVPPWMQAELVAMTWLDDHALMMVADERMPAQDQQRLAELSTNAGLSAEERQTLQTLRDRYGQLTLRKARAFALLSVRGGKALLGAARAD
jgi:hypothetical protein